MTEKMNDIRFPSVKEEKPIPRKKRSKKWILFPILFLVLASSYLYFRSYQVEIKISPVTEKFTETRTVSIHASSEESDLVAEVFEETIQGSREFIVMGRSVVERKTRGTINVCQDHSDLVQSLVANTRFVSTEGKLFFAEERITIPGRSYREGRVVPGCATVNVVAAEAGEDYNISSSSKFSLPALQGTALYGRFSGDSFSITEEGRREEVPYITADEIRRAEIILLDELFEKGMNSLKGRLSGEFLLDNTGQYNRWVVERSVPREGEERESFQIEMKIKMEVIAVNLDSVTLFSKNLVPEGYVWHEESKKIEYDFPRANFEEKSGEMDITLDANIYQEIDKVSLKRRLSGMSFNEAVYELKRMPEISDVSIRFYPFGPSSIVSNPDRILIELTFDKN